MGARWPAAVQVRSHRFTDVRGQWQTFGTVRFTTHEDFAGSPIDIVEHKLSDFARPQAEPDQHGQDREIAAAVVSVAIAGCQKAVDLVRIQALGQPGQSPPGDRWHRGSQRPLDYAFDMEEAEQ